MENYWTNDDLIEIFNYDCHNNQEVLNIWNNIIEEWFYMDGNRLIIVYDDIYEEAKRLHPNIWNYSSNHIFISDKYYHRQGAYGVYGIRVNDELVYVGYTSVSFAERWKQHLSGIKNHSPKMYLYKCISIQDKINFEVLFNAKEEGIERNDYELLRQERKFIQLYQPKYNIAGK